MIKKSLSLLFVSVLFAIPASYLIIEWKKSKTTPEYYLAKLEEKALLGDSNAMYRLGNNYYYGYNDLAIDFDVAFKWYQLSADGGYAEAMNSLGLMYKDGESVAENNKEAVYWLEKAAALDDTNAQINLAKIYNDGLRADQDLEKAFSLWKKAADKGSARAQFRIGHFYYEGRGHVDKDISQAVHWYKKSSDNNFSPAQYNLAIMYAKGDGVVKDALLSGSLYKKVANNSSKKAKGYRKTTQDYLEKTEEHCISLVSPTPEQVKSCFISAGAGVYEAQKKLSLFYYHGQGVSQDNIKSLAWALISNSKDKENASNDSEDKLQLRAIAAEYILLLELPKKDIEAAATLANDYRKKYF